MDCDLNSGAFGRRFEAGDDLAVSVTFLSSAGSPLCLWLETIYIIVLSLLTVFGRNC
jgi:hypothetical protein